MTPFPLVLSSPSGGGKTTIAKALLAARDDLGYSISATTRAMRPGEIDGKDYFFLKRAEFERRVAAGEFVEHAEYGGHLYGTLKAQLEAVLAAGNHVVLDIEIQGAREVKRLFSTAVLVFIVPPSAEELYKRLGGPGGTRGPNFELRLKRAVVELNEALQYDYVVINADRTDAVVELNEALQYDYVVINADRTDAVADVAAIIDAESRRTKHNPELNEQLGQLGRDITAMLDRTTTPAGD